MHILKFHSSESLAYKFSSDCLGSMFNSELTSPSYFSSVEIKMSVKQNKQIVSCIDAATWGLNPRPQEYDQYIKIYMILSHHLQ